MRAATQGPENAIPVVYVGLPPAVGRRGEAPARDQALDLPRSTLVLTLVSCIAAVLLLGYLREVIIGAIGLDTALKDLRHIALDAEQTVSVWLSSIVLFADAMLLAAMSALMRRSRDRDWRAWALLAGIFAAMSMDELVSFHEVLIKPLRALLALDGPFFFAWVVPGTIAVAAVGLYYLAPLLRLPRRQAVRFGLCGVVYVGGALGMEMVSGALAARFGMEATPYLVASSAEETLELLGAALFCWVLVAYLRERWPDWSIRIG